MNFSETLLRLITKKEVQARPYIEYGYIFSFWHPFNNCANRRKGNIEVAIAQPSRGTAESQASQNSPVCNSCGATYLLSTDVRSWGHWENRIFRNG